MHNMKVLEFITLQLFIVTIDSSFFGSEYV